MGNDIVLTFSANEVYKEVRLPILNDADYEMLLSAEEFALPQDVVVPLEALQGTWRFRESSQCRVFQDGEPFEGKAMSQGQLLELAIPHGKKIPILVMRSSGKLRAFRKYRINGGNLTIGQDADNDICFRENAQQKVVSAHHAELRFDSGDAQLMDLSTNGTYVDHRRLHGSTPLRIGQTISIYGLSILYLGEILAVNCYNGETVVNPEKLTELLPAEKESKPERSLFAAASEDTVHISPRASYEMYDEPETIESVPQKQPGEDRPAWMSILPSLTMVLPMVVGFLLMNGGMGAGIVIAIGSAVVGVSWAIINYRFATKTKKQNELKRLEKYEQYLVRRSDSIREKYEHNRVSLLRMYPDAGTCANYRKDSLELWARRYKNSDFLFLRLGIGEMPFQVRIETPHRSFSLTEDELAERPQKIAESFAVLRDVPLGVEMRKNNVIGVLADGDRNKLMEIMRVMVAQIAANHSYTDVKLAFVFRGDRETAPQWDFVRWLPHVWNEDRSQRYVGDEENGVHEVLYSLTQVLRGREEQSQEFSSRERSFLPYYVLFVEDPSMLESQIITKYLYEGGTDLGITTVILADAYEALPGACDCVVECGRAFSGVYGTQESDERRHSLRFDSLSDQSAQMMARGLSGLRVNQVEMGNDIPTTLTFLNMLGVQSLKETQVLEHWRKNRTYDTMRAVIGQKVGGQDCYLDIHEKYHGPHGLVAGTTGSGKSETLQTYILSLAMQFSPLDIGFFIIDFKGGGMANLFSGLPHLIGQISNLSGNQVRRAMVSINSEKSRRERIFGEFGVKKIDEYTKLVKSGEAEIPIPHLLIIIDEFAELKREQPDFMRELISIAAVGRSLGIHLILSTQKPSGTVDDNIWSNTRFKLCLRVADKQDSNDMLHKPDAAYLTQAGRGYLQVGNDEIYEMFQSGWSGAVYDEGGFEGKTSAILIDLQGRELLSVSRNKSEERHEKQRQWMRRVAAVLLEAAGELGESPDKLDREGRGAAARRATILLNQKEECFANSPASIQRLEEMLECWPQDARDSDEVADRLTVRFQREGRKLPEQIERTQLDAVVHYLAELAEANGFVNGQELWMPLLPDPSTQKLRLEDLAAWRETTFHDGAWPEHSGEFRLKALVGLVDDPENQLQYPLTVDLAEKGHLAVVGGVTSGKSTFLQSLIFSLISTYSPAELNVYVVDYSSQMLLAFEGDAHVGGVVLESEEEKLDKLFVMLTAQLQRRKEMIRGGSFSQYIQVHGHVLPAVLVVIDGYANFNEKTEGKYESLLLELSRTAEGFGIFLAISCAGFGGGELQNKIASNMRQSIALEMGEKYRYSEALRIMGLEVLPEENVKGRGLALVEGRPLEYQTALACDAENDYQRSEQIREICADRSKAWTGRRAAPIPSIPERPRWKEFQELDEYEIRVKEEKQLPAAYFQETASLYGVDRKKTFCYLVLGSERSGKSTYMRNLMRSAKSSGGKRYFADTAEKADAAAAGLCDEYFAEPEELLAMVRVMIELTNERASLRRELQGQGLEDDEIWERMEEKFPPVYYFIGDLGDFVNRVYTRLEGIGKLNAWVENILKKGKLLNIYFFAALDISQIPLIADKAIYQIFSREKKGVLLGGELNRQTVFSYQNIRYNDQAKRLKPGLGYAVNAEDDQIVDLIVIPGDRGSGAT